MPLRISSFADECYSAAGAAGSARPPNKYLYKYVSVKSALRAILNGQVYFSARAKFNDPFDGKVAINTDTGDNRGKLIRRTHKILKILRQVEGKTFPALTENEFSENVRRLENKVDFANRIEDLISQDHDRLNIGSFCMSERYDSSTMWAHYADSHRGCCLVFNAQSFSASDWRKKFPFVFVGKIKYAPLYPKFPGAESLALHQEGSFYMTKSKDWDYEKEWRAIAYDARVKPSRDEESTFQKAFSRFPGLSEKMTGAGAYSLSGTEMLAGVILGVKMSDSDKKAVVGAANCRNLAIAKARPNTEKGTYGIIVKAYTPKHGR